MYPAKLEFEPWKNKQINRYVLRKFKIFNQLAQNKSPQANTLIQSRRLIGLYTVLPTWQRKYKLNEIIKLSIKVHKINQTTVEKIKYKRI